MSIVGGNSGQQDIGTIKPEKKEDGFEVPEFDASEVYDQRGTQFEDRKTKSYSPGLKFPGRPSERNNIDRIPDPEPAEVTRTFEDDGTKNSISEIYDKVSRITTKVTNNGYKVGGVREAAVRMGVDRIGRETPYQERDSGYTPEFESSSLEEAFNQQSAWKKVTSFLG